MKDKEKRNKKGSENNIGKIIYSFLLFMPIFAIGITCGYAMFNKNAYQSYADNSSEYQYINNTNDIDINKEYYFYNGFKSSYVALPGNASSNYIVFNILEVIDNPNNYNLTNVLDCGFFSSSTSNLNIGFYFHYSDGTSTLNISSNNSLKLKIQIISYSSDFISSLPYMNILAEKGNENSLSNVFYYSVDKVSESPLFNWAENSIIYTTTNATCNALSITTPFIPLLLSYWLIISVMYFLYDIALMLIWVVHDKIHALKDSIT